MSLGERIQQACERAIYLYADELDDANATANHMAAAAMAVIGEEAATMDRVTEWRKRTGQGLAGPADFHELDQILGLSK